jgi:hypothetical protein
VAAGPLQRLRRICLALPGAHEKIAWGEPTFRVRDRLFAMYADARNHHGGGRHAVWCKATHLTQDMVVHRAPDRYFVPPYVGPSGWFGIYLDRSPDWEEVADRLREAYREVAPKRLLAELDAPRGRR